MGDNQGGTANFTNSSLRQFRLGDFFIPQAKEKE